MKFAHGILEPEEKGKKSETAEIRQSAERPEAPATVEDSEQGWLHDVEKNRLFETQEKVVGSSRNYLKVLLVMSILVLLTGGAIFYFTLPKIGDQVLGPKGLEDAVRAHFSDTEKRTATDITFYYCDKYYWARVGVEMRVDIPNPLFRIGIYQAKATPTGADTWDISASPITSPEMDRPCS